MKKVIILIVVAVFAGVTLASVGALGDPQATGGKCNHDSDCKYGKCKSNKCGNCYHDSDCKGFGKCRSGECGGCNHDSDCKGFGKCRSGKCTKTPW
jgi:hypothetical protein